MKYVEFCLEAHRNASGRLIVVNVAGQEVERPVPFQAIDVSQGFNSLDTPLKDFAYYLRFTLPYPDDHVETVTAVARKHGVEPQEFLDIAARAEVVSFDGTCPHCGCDAGVDN